MLVSFTFFSETKRRVSKMVLCKFCFVCRAKQEMKYMSGSSNPHRHFQLRSKPFRSKLGKLYSLPILVSLSSTFIYFVLVAEKKIKTQTFGPVQVCQFSLLFWGFKTTLSRILKLCILLFSHSYQLVLDS